jgi:hypothetical protein
MRNFINTKIDPVVIFSCFLANTYTYLEDFKINDKFVEEAIKKYMAEETFDREIIDKIRSLVFCGKNLTKESVFLHIWTSIIVKFLPDEVDLT